MRRDDWDNHNAVDLKNHESILDRAVRATDFGVNTTHHCPSYAAMYILADFDAIGVGSPAVPARTFG